MLPSVFVIGCARSGTTILGKFFENNTKCQYYNEINIWEKDSLLKFNSSSPQLSQKIIRKLKQHPIIKILRSFQFKWNMFLDYIGIIEQDYGHRLTESDVTLEMFDNVKKILAEIDKKRIVIKNPRNSLRIPFIKKLFPDAKFLHIIRDGRDVTCSLMGNHNSGYWAHVKPPNWKEWQKKHAKGPLKYAWQWNETINIIYSDKGKILSNDYVEIRYEDLVNEPEKTMRDVFKKFEIPFEKPQEELSKKVQNEMKDSFEATPGWTVSDHSKRIGRYMENLSKQELQIVENVIKKNNSRFGYS